MNNLEITNIKDMLKKTGELYGDKPAYKFKTETPNNFKTISHREVREMVDSLGTSLVSLLNLKDKRVGIIGENRYEWEVAYLSIVAGTGVVVPFDKALPENELDSLIKRSEVEAIFYTKPYENTLVRLAKDSTTKLKHLICLDYENHLDNIYSFKELIKKGKNLLESGNTEFIDAKVSPEQVASMLFTSRNYFSIKSCYAFSKKYLQ